MYIVTDMQVKNLDHETEESFQRGEKIRPEKLSTTSLG